MNRQVDNGNSVRKRTFKTLCTVLFLSLMSISTHAAEPGLTPGELGVSATGATEYSVPIAIPPGTAGMAPSLSLNYNSQGGNGPLGVGWSLSGLSAITRCPQTLAKDGFIRGVKMDAQDKLCLDGQRLIKVSGGTYGGNGTQYRTAVDSFSLITSYGLQNGFPMYFTVKTKAGQTMVYGNSARSRIEAQGTEHVRIWALNFIKDTFGNYINFTYVEDGDQLDYRIDRIDYTGNIRTGLAPYSSVRFEYIARPRKASGYIAGYRFEQKKLIKKIRAFNGETLVRDYTLDYDTTGTVGQPRIIKLTECASVGKCFEPIAFAWSPELTGLGALASNPSLRLSAASGPGQWVDFNGDGKMDYCLIQGLSGNGRLACYLSNGSALTTTPILSALAVDRGSNYGREWADVNGDGMADFCRVRGTASNQIVTCTLSTGTGFGGDINSAHMAVGGWGQGEGRRWVDFNGDGRADYCRVPSGSSVACTLSTGVGFDDTNTIVGNNLPATGGYREWADINSDGMADFCSGAACTLSQGSSFGTSIVIGTSVYNPKWFDINGDGNKDMCWQGGARTGGALNPGSSRKAVCRLFTGTGFGETIESETFMRTGSTFGGTQLQPITSGTLKWSDINNDGLVDACLSYQEGSPLTGLDSGTLCVLSNGSGFESPAPASGMSTHVVLVDINGDGIADHCTYANCQLGNTRPQVRITGITNSLGSQTNIIYKPLTDGSVYRKDTGGADDPLAVYPSVDIQAAIYVVSSVKTDNGIGGQNETKYTYGGARAHMRGLGFLGFRWMRAIDQETGIRTGTVYRQDYPYIGMLHWTSTHQADPEWTIISSTINKLSVIDYGNGRYFPYVQTSTQNGYEIDGNLLTTVKTDYVYDNLGNATDITSTTTGNGQTFTTYTDNDYTYNLDPNKWYLGRLTRSSVTQSVTGLSPQTRVSAFEYDLTGHGLLTVETIEPDKDESTGLKLSTRYEYDEYGNKKYVKTDAGAGSAARITTTSYTGGGHNPGQFPITVTNALGQSESHTYDARYGVMTSLTGPNSLTTNWLYDDFGRQTKELRVDGTSTTITRTWCNPNDCPTTYSLAKVTKSTGSAAVTEYSDRLGRVVQTNGRGSIKGSDNHGSHNTSFSQTHYNAKGQVQQKSHPMYYDAVTPQSQVWIWTYFKYDVLGRLTEEIDNNGQKIIYTHNGFTTQVTNRLNQTTTRITNARGELVQVIDADQNPTSYYYDVFGNQTNVVDAVGNSTALGYNIRGQKKWMIDPDMGTWYYDYNAYGELISQTDAKTQTTTMKYDLLGRMIERTDPECTSFWVYGSSNNSGSTGGNAIGKLVYTQRGDKEKIYTHYDEYGRPNKVITTLFGKTFTTQTRYDAASRVNEITYPASIDYPTGLKVQNHYDTNGYLETVTDDAGFKYWEALDQNARGQVTGFSLGNAVTTTTRHYNQINGLVDSITTSRAGGTGNVQDLDFQFDVLGNLKERNAHRQSSLLTETFSYDHLNRLKTATVAGQAQKSYQYDALGNLTFKTGVGFYTYGGGNAGPHAVTNTSIGDKDYTYDANGNMETGDGRDMTWSSYNKPIHITQNGNSSAFVYGANRNRIRQINDDKTIYYVNSLFEQEFDGLETTYVHYIKAGGSTIATIKSYETIDGGLSKPKETRYLHKDHLGGIETITDENASIMSQLSYDPHGKRRNVDWTDDNGSLPEYDINRGFTGHEHLDNVGLIHMNGRVYDPTLGRFLSADPFVQFPESGQSLNRYSYVMNNPLSFSDPSGFGLFSFFKKIFKNKIFRAVASLVAAYFTFGASLYLGASNAVASFAAGFAGGFVGSGGNLKSGFIGGVTALAFYGVGHRIDFASKFGKGASFAKTLAHGVVGGVSQALNGGKFAAGFLSAGFTQATSGIKSLYAEGNGINFRNTAIAATIGGTASVIGGGKFANGATSGAFAQLFGSSGTRQQGSGGGLVRGALDIVGKIWNLPNTIIGNVIGGVGHVVGEIGNALGLYGPEPTIGFGHNAIEFKNNPFMASGGAITFGNSIIYGSQAYDHAPHEMIHTYQGQFLGPLYLPVNILGMAASALSYPISSLRRSQYSDPFHGRLNFMEGNPFNSRLYSK